MASDDRRETEVDAGWSRPDASTSTSHDEGAGDAVLELETVTKRFGREVAVAGCSLTVREGELLTILGPSGCGKTTLLRILAGLERPDDGIVRIDGDPVAGDGRFVPSTERDVGLVFQEFALFPHLTAGENVAYGIAGLPADERERRVERLLELVGLEDHAEAVPEELSGGQRQRIALARSLAPEPAVLLLDEPFANLDAALGVEMREEVRRILTETGVTAVSVTHDQEEALSVSDRIAVMNDGRFEQVGTPESVFQRPTSRFVASFLGHASFLRGRVDGDVVRTALGALPRERVFGLDPEYDRTKIDLLLRPDDLVAAPADRSVADGRVIYRRYLGPTVLYRVKLETGEVVEVEHNHTEGLDLDDPVCVTFVADHGFAWFPPTDGRRSAAP